MAMNSRNVISSNGNDNDYSNGDNIQGTRSIDGSQNLDSTIFQSPPVTFVLPSWMVRVASACSPAVRARLLLRAWRLQCVPGRQLFGCAAIL